MASKRYRMTIPEKDESVIKFLDMQENLSMSLRMVIKDYITRKGYMDVLCEEISETSKRGRPAKEESEMKKKDKVKELKKKESTETEEPEKRTKDGLDEEETSALLDSMLG